MKNFKDFKAQIENNISDLIKSHTALKCLWEKFTEDTDYSVTAAILNTLYDIAPERTASFVKAAVEYDVYPDKTLCFLLERLKEKPYMLESEDRYDKNKSKFSEIIDIVLVNHDILDNRTLMEVGSTAEYLFAHGYTELARYIYKIYNMVHSYDCDERAVIHKRLTAAYSYNGMNYKDIYNDITEIYKKCKHSKRKFMYGEIYYHYAVLEVLRKKKHKDRIHEYIKRACEYRYDMARILKRHFKENTE